MDGIQLDEKNDLEIHVQRDASGKITGGLLVADRTVQDAYIVLSSNQGEIKEDPVCGANLLRLVRGKRDDERVKKTIQQSLQRVGIGIDELKSVMRVIINKQQVNV